MMFKKDSKIERPTEKEYDSIPNQGLKYGLYSFYDVCSQTFGNPFVCQNDEVAMREKRAFCMLPQNQYLANDLRLYRLGMFAPMTGEIVGDIVLLVEDNGDGGFVNEVQNS